MNILIGPILIELVKSCIALIQNNLYHFRSKQRRFRIRCQIIYRDWELTNSSYVFTNLFRLFYPRIFLSLSSWKRKQTFYWSQTDFSIFIKNGNRSPFSWFLNSQCSLNISYLTCERSCFFYQIVHHI